MLFFSRYAFFLYGIVFILVSCAKVVDKNEYKLVKIKNYMVLPFRNYTDTPLAGYKVASMVEGIMRVKGYEVVDSELGRERDIYKEGLEKVIRSVRKGVDYIVTGTVSEYEYKVGVEGEPVVSFTIYVIDTATGRVVKSATLSAQGSSYDSLGTITQKLLREFF